MERGIRVASARSWREFGSVTLAVCVLAAVSALTVAVASAAFHDYRTVAPVSDRCEMPSLRGTVVSVRLVDIRSRTRVVVAPTQVPRGTVSFRVANTGLRKHELVVRGLANGAERTSGVGSVGEASATCAAGPGGGIAAGSFGWVTLRMPPGRYELVCTLPGEADRGRYAEFDVG